MFVHDNMTNFSIPIMIAKNGTNRFDFTTKYKDISIEDYLFTKSSRIQPHGLLTSAQKLFCTEWSCYENGSTPNLKSINNNNNNDNKNKFFRFSISS